MTPKPASSSGYKAALFAGLLCSPAADGQVYRVTGGPVAHLATKAAASALTDLGLRTLGLPKPVASLTASVGLWAVAKGIETRKGHVLGCRDALGDLAWHVAGVTLIRRDLLGFSLSASIGIGLGRWSSPRWR